MKIFSKISILLLVLSLVLTGCDVNISTQEYISSIEETESLTESGSEKATTSGDEAQSTEGESQTTGDESQTTEGESQTTSDESQTTGGEESTTENKEDILDLNPAPDSEISIISAIAIGQTYSHNQFSQNKYYVRGTVSEIVSSSKGSLNIQDSRGNTLLIYQTYNSDGSVKYSSMSSKPQVGDTVLIYGIIGNYDGISEMKNGWIISFSAGSSGGGSTPNIGDDPYENISKSQFYANYKPATSWEDAYWRTQHNFMSGTIALQDQRPTISSYQPKQNGVFEKNYSMLYSDDGNTYYVLDAYGNVAMEIYRGGAYVMLEEVAAYVFAFGTIPPNYNPDKYATNSSSSPWGEYLRLNNSKFSGNTSSYPYEPELPDITGCGGRTQYYEIDIGTTGTDCDPGYTAALYNNGSRIIRGAARIVYGRRDINGNGAFEANEIYVFYTYNHYNDFQEYLNYYGGWGEMFGNITGGGTISSKTHYNPTDYVPVIGVYFANSKSTPTPQYEDIAIYFIDTRHLYYTSQMCA